MSLIYPSVKVPFTYLMFIYKMYYNIQSIDLPEVVTLSFTGKRPDHRKSLTMDRKHVTETDDPLVPVHCVLAAFANPNGLPDPPVVKILLSFSSNVYDPLLTISRKSKPVTSGSTTSGKVSRRLNRSLQRKFR